MRLNRVSLAAAGAVIMPIDPHKTQVNSLTSMYGSSTVSATAQVDATVSDLGNKIPVTLSRSSTTVTVTFPTGNPHTLGGVTDYIVIAGSGVTSLDGTYSVASVTNDTVLTYSSGTSGTTTANAYAVPVRFMKTMIASASVSATTPAFPAVTTTSLYLETIPFSGLILNCTSYSAGTVYCDNRQGGLD